MDDEIVFKKDGLIFSKSTDDKVFKRNGEVMKEMDGQTITADKEITFVKFKRIVQSNVSEFINQAFSNIVVLVGAGASVVSTKDGIDPKYGKTVSMIAEDVLNKLDTRKYKPFSAHKERAVLSLQDLSKNIQYLDNICYKNKDGELKLIKKFNLEDFLSKLITYIEFVNNKEEIWKDSLEAIFDIIKRDTNYKYNEDVFNHGKLINILSKKLNAENKLNLVTTNYDTLLEDAAEKNHYTVFDGFSFSREPRFDDDMFEWHLSKHVSNVHTHENIYKHQVINLLKIHGSLTWRQHGDEVIRTSKNAKGTPVMIFPSSNKYMQSYEEPYFELFSRFQGMLRQPNTLLITIGFSFSDKHIARMVTQAIEHNPGLCTLVTDLNISPKNPNMGWKEMERLMRRNHEIVYLQGTLNGDLTDYLGEFNEN